MYAVLCQLRHTDTLFSFRSNHNNVGNISYYFHMLFYRSPCYVSGLGNISVVLPSMQGQTALRFHQKYLNLCSEDERRSYGFEMT